MRNPKITLVLTPRAEKTGSWSGTGAILLSNYSLLDAALHAGVTEYGREIARVIFDRSIDPMTFLDFLTKLPVGFRGDVLLVLDDGRGYLSAVSPHEGRYLYSLSSRDVSFYRETAVAEERIPSPAAFEISDSREWQAS